MQWAKSWFVKPIEEPKEEENVLTTEQVIQSLKLKRMEKKHESKTLEAEAKTLFKSGNRAKAAAVLQRRNVVETRLRQINAQLANVEQQQTTIESAAMASDIAASMKNGVRETQRVISRVDIGDIDEIVDDMEDLNVQSFELTEALARPTAGSAFMDVDVDDKIASQLAEWADEGQLDLPSVPTRTTVPMSGLDDPNKVTERL